VYVPLYPLTSNPVTTIFCPAINGALDCAVGNEIVAILPLPVAVTLVMLADIVAYELFNDNLVWSIAAVDMILASSMTPSLIPVLHVM
jgi:hypothetical protein